MKKKLSCENSEKRNLSSYQSTLIQEESFKRNFIMSCLSLLQVVVQLIISIKLITSQSQTSITFRSVKKDATFVGVEPFYNQTTFSLTECYLACIQQLERCFYIEVVNVNETWSCKLFQILEKDIKKHVKPLEGYEIVEPRVPVDCRGLKELGYNEDGVYVIRGIINRKVFCDMTTDGGGWIVMQKRFDGSVDFYRNWNDYKIGFGDVNGEYWLGNKQIYQYTNKHPTEMITEAAVFNGDQVATKIQNFKLTDEASKYIFIKGTCEVLKGGELGVTCANWEKSHGQKFSTYDQDNDIAPETNCAQRYAGGWWFEACFDIKLNGNYSHKEQLDARATGIHWKQFLSLQFSLRETKMLLRRLK